MIYHACKTPWAHFRLVPMAHRSCVLCSVGGSEILGEKDIPIRFAVSLKIHTNRIISVPEWYENNFSGW